MNCISLKEQKGEIKMKRAFTLIELMIVMAVMAILVGIALPRFKGMREEGNIAKAEGELRTLKTAIESYAMHHGNAYPASSTTPYASYLDASAAPGPQLIASVLYDPFASGSTTEYYYVRGSGSGTDYYAICSRGPDGAVDVTASEVSNGALTSGEIDDDICASNATLP
jgi:prepilin-type N-terminal cleavage/methylation domain-containing protein